MGSCSSSRSADATKLITAITFLLFLAPIIFEFAYFITGHYGTALGGIGMVELLYAFVVMILMAILLSGIRIVKEWERVPVLRLGRYTGCRGPGLTYIIPFIESVPARVSLRTHVEPVRSERMLTKDNVPVNVDAVMYYRPVDVDKCILNIEEYAEATRWAAETSLRETLGKCTLDELLAEREKLGSHLRGIIDEKTEAWGVKVTAVEIRDVVIPVELQDAMSRQAQAERERRARITLAEAELKASQTILEAARTYAEHPAALQLRLWHMIHDIGMGGRASLIMVPWHAVPPIGIMGVEGMEELMRRQERRSA